METKTLRRLLVFWVLFVGVGALFGAFMMFFDTTGETFGMAPMLPFFQVLPLADILFQNFLLPGIALLCVNGLTNLLTFYLLLKRNKLGSRAGMLCGVLLMLWICIQFYIFPLNFTSTLFFFIGLLEGVTAYCLYRKEKNDFRQNRVLKNK